MSEKPPTFNPNIPQVHSISSSRLKEIGFIKFGVEPGVGQSIVTTYKRGEEEVRYNGAGWYWKNKIVEFIEDLA